MDDQRLQRHWQLRRSVSSPVLKSSTMTCVLACWRGWHISRRKDLHVFSSVTAAPRRLKVRSNSLVLLPDAAELWLCCAVFMAALWGLSRRHGSHIIAN